MKFFIAFYCYISYSVAHLLLVALWDSRTESHKCGCCIRLLCSDQQQRTTWMHPVTGRPVQTGLIRDAGWSVLCLS